MLQFKLLIFTLSCPSLGVICLHTGRRWRPQVPIRDWTEIVERWKKIRYRLALNISFALNYKQYTVNIYIRKEYQNFKKNDPASFHCPIFSSPCKCQKYISKYSILPGIRIYACTQHWRDGKTNALLNFMPDAEF